MYVLCDVLCTYAWNICCVYTRACKGEWLPIHLCSGKGVEEMCLCVRVCVCLSAVRESPSIPGTPSPSPSPSLSLQVAEGGGQPCQKLIGSQ